MALIRARGLSPLTHGYFGPALADPFATLHVNDEERQSGVANRTLEPQWNEKFKIPAADIADVMLKITISDWNLGSTCEMLGQVEVSLHHCCDRKAHQRWFPLSFDGADSDGKDSCGEIELALRWVHNPRLCFFDTADTRDGIDEFPGMRLNCLRIAVIRANNLSASGFSGSGNPSVTISILDDMRSPAVGTCNKSREISRNGRKSWGSYRSSCTSTRIEQNTLEPRWHEVFALPCAQKETGEIESIPGHCPRVCVEVEDHTFVGILGALGATEIDLCSLLDRRRQRLWLSLEASCKTRYGEQIIQPRGRLELALQ